MLTHYLNSSLRHFRRHKLTTAINIASLALGLICFIMAFALTQYLRESDRHHRNADRLYAISERIYVPGTEVSYPTVAFAAWPLADYLKTDFPQLEAVVRASTSGEVPVASGGRKAFMQVTYADPGFFEIFDFTFLKGGAADPLAERRSAVVSEAFAMRMFGTTDVIGRPLLIRDAETVFIRAVIGAVPRPSHMSTEGQPSSLYFETVVSMDTHEALRRVGLPPEVEQVRFGRLTGALNYFTYVLLPRDGTLTPERLRAELATFGDRHISEGEVRADFGALHISEISSQSMDMMIGSEKTGVSFIGLLIALGTLVLLVSCLNYANLAAAQAETRTKEVAVRKIIGAARGEVVLQHATEALLATGAAMGIALAVVAALNMTSSALMRAALRVGVFDAPVFWLLLTALIVAVSAIASSYPSLLLARVKPAQGLRAGKAKGASGVAGKVLVGAQFASASLLLILVLVMRDQNEAVRRAGVGIESDPVVMIANDAAAAKVDMDLLRTELLRQPHVQAVGAAMTQPLSLNGNSYGTVSLSAEQSAARVAVVQQYVDYDFLSTMKFEVIAGRGFDRTHGADAMTRSSVGEQAVIIDRALVEHYGWSGPAEAVGKLLYEPTIGGVGRAATPLRVIGVVESKPLTLLGLGAASTIYQLAPGLASTPLIRVSGADIEAALAEIDAVWNRLAPNIALKRRFLDEQLEQNYEIFYRLTGAFAMLATLACVIAGMGLVGMAIHIVSRRMHEIGVRKTLGASIAQVLRMLLFDFSRPIVIANLIVWPIAFLAASAYLAVFVQRAPLTPWPFLMSLAVTVLIAWAAVIAQVGKAARLKPAQVLRYE